MNPISSCVPAEIAEREWDSWPDYSEFDAREKERRVDEELAWLLRSPECYCEKAGEDIFFQLVRILTDSGDDKIGRCHDVLDLDMRRVAENEAEKP